MPVAIGELEVVPPAQAGPSPAQKRPEGEGDAAPATREMTREIERAELTLAERARRLRAT